MATPAIHNSKKKPTALPIDVPASPSAASGTAGRNASNSAIEPDVSDLPVGLRLMSLSPSMSPPVGFGIFSDFKGVCRSVSNESLPTDDRGVPRTLGEQSRNSSSFNRNLQLLDGGAEGRRSPPKNHRLRGHAKKLELPPLHPFGQSVADGDAAMTSGAFWSLFWSLSSVSSASSQASPSPTSPGTAVKQHPFGQSVADGDGAMTSGLPCSLSSASSASFQASPAPLQASSASSTSPDTALEQRPSGQSVDDSDGAMTSGPQNEAGGPDSPPAQRAKRRYWKCPLPQELLIDMRAVLDKKMITRQKDERYTPEFKRAREKLLTDSPDKKERERIKKWLDNHTATDYEQDNDGRWQRKASGRRQRQNDDDGDGAMTSGPQNEAGGEGDSPPAQRAKRHYQDNDGRWQRKTSGRRQGAYRRRRQNDDDGMLLSPATSSSSRSPDAKRRKSCGGGDGGDGGGGGGGDAPQRCIYCQGTAVSGLQGPEDQWLCASSQCVLAFMQ